MMTKHTPTPDSFAPVEARLIRICSRLPAHNRQDVLLKHLLKHVAAGLADDMDTQLKAHGLNNVSFTALMMLYNSDITTLNPSDLSAATGESRANVTRICDELVAKELLTRAPNAEDRRRIDLMLAPLGRAAVERLLPVMRERLESMFQPFAEEEKTTLEYLLKRLLHQIDKLR